ncbi:hypothetical protein [Bdellovibrio sp.]|uniref:hypothetical protein n=1 Tax=Bdellovibrio sp. TaxID=28201 RepID=UPI0039E27128
MALFVHDINEQPNAFTTTLSQIPTAVGIHDPGSFATAALDIYENGWISPNNAWILNLWPPGFILLEVSIVKIFGINTPIILILQIIASLLFSWVLALLYKFFSVQTKSYVAFGVPLLIFAFPVSRVFLLQPIGLVLGESFSIGFFLLTLLYSIKSVEKKSVWYSVWAGVFLALSAYFRSQFELILMGITGWALLMGLYLYIKKTSQTLRTAGKSIMISIVVAHTATIPWRLYHWKYQGSPLWTQTSGVTFENSVLSPEELEKKSGSLVVTGGGNLVCRINPTVCNDRENARHLFFKTFFENPSKWYAIKLSLIGKFWYTSVGGFWKTPNEVPSMSDLFINSSFLSMLLALPAMLVTRRVRSHPSWLPLTLLTIALFSTYILIFTVQQFESRYFFFPKIVITFIFLITASIFLRPKDVAQELPTTSN